MIIIWLYSSTFLFIVTKQCCAWQLCITKLISYALYLRHNRAKSIARSAHGDPWLESCKNPAVIRRLSKHPALIRRWPGKFNSQLIFARHPPDGSTLFLIRRRPVGHRPIPEQRSVGHRRKCSSKNPHDASRVIERRSADTYKGAHAWRPSCDSRGVTREVLFDDPAIAMDDRAGIR